MKFRDGVCLCQNDLQPVRQLHACALRPDDRVLRRQRRRQTRLRLGRETSGSLNSLPAPQRDGGPADPEGWGGRPQRGMERDELMARLHGELAKVGGLSRDVWDLLARGVRLREIAAALGLSYDAAKRQRRKLIAYLRASLGEE